MVATEQVYKKLADASANTSSLSGAQEDEVKCQGRCQSVDLFSNQVERRMIMRLTLKIRGISIRGSTDSRDADITVNLPKLPFRLGICSETKLTNGALCFRLMTVACPPVGSLIRASVSAVLLRPVRRTSALSFCHIAWRVFFVKSDGIRAHFVCDKVQKQLHPRVIGEHSVFGTEYFQRLVDHVDIAVAAREQTILFQLGTSSRRYEERHSNICAKKKREHHVQLSLVSDHEQGLAARA